MDLLPFPQDQIMFLFWQQLSTTELCHGPIMLQTTDPITKGHSSSLSVFALLFYRTGAPGNLKATSAKQRTIIEKTTSLQETDCKSREGGRTTGTWGRNKEMCGAKKTTSGIYVYHCYLALPFCTCTSSPEHSSLICTLNSSAAQCSSQLFHVILEQTVKTLVL